MTHAGCPDPLVVIVGPTASGKTELAVRLAEQCRGEIVSADSVQVYRHFELGTGKPSAEQRARAAHHLIDIAEPLDSMDAARWAERAARAISEIRDRGRTPLVCGGTFLWIRALLFGLVALPPANSELRARHREIAERLGRLALHDELSRLDPLSAARLSPNDFVRVSRALEVFELTGKSLSQWHAQHGFREPRYSAKLIGIRHLPEELDRRIAERTRTMLQTGWLGEVKALVSRGFGAARAMSSVGYRELFAHVQGERSADEATLYADVRRATRIFARRQRTWLREEPVTWLDVSEAASLRFADLLVQPTKLS